ncbi:MAG: fluoride efflux transporter CrcB [Bryobacteraceae bacterium]
MPWLLVAAGSALGGVGRLAIYLLLTRLGADSFPWGTVVVNLLGSGVIGWFAGTSPPTSMEARYFVMTGICGGFTTFSTFSLDTLNMLRAGEAGKAIAYVALQLGLCLAGVWLGHAAAGRR